MLLWLSHGSYGDDNDVGRRSKTAIRIMVTTMMMLIKKSRDEETQVIWSRSTNVAERYKVYIK